MTFYTDESQLYKCPKHPSRRRTSGICPKCLRERLVTLCPDCATARPCNCSPSPLASSSSSSSSTSSNSFSLFSFSRGGSRRNSDTLNTELNNLESNIPTLRKSRSVAVSFLRSRSRHVGTDINNNILLPKVSRSKINFWSVFTVNKSKKCDLHVDTGIVEEMNKCDEELNKCDDNPVMMRSRSVAVGAGDGFASAKTTKQKGWYFPSQIKGLRYSKPPRSVVVS